MDLERMRYRMTMTKIDLVARKSLNLYKMRILLNQTRRLVREEEDIMGDFTGVKAVIDSDPRGQLDEDDYMDTKGRLLNLGSKLTDNRRKQQRLAGQVEELQAATNALVDAAEMPEMEDHEFDMESFKRESSALPEMPRLAPSLPSYDLFNHAPYSPAPSRPGSAMSMDGERPGSALERIRERSKHRTVKVSVAMDSTDEEDVGNEAYLPQRSGLKKKKDYASRSKRAPSETSETSDGEDSAYNVFTNTRMTPMEAKHKAEEDRKRAAEVEEKLHEQLKKEEEEVKKKEEELQKKKSIGDDKKNSAPGAKQKTEQDAKAKQQQNGTTDKKKEEAAVAKKKKSEETTKKEDEEKISKLEKQKAEEQAKKEAATKKEAEAKKNAEAKKEAETAAKKEADAKKEAAAKKEAESVAKKEAEAAAKKEAETAKNEAAARYVHRKLF